MVLVERQFLDALTLQDDFVLPLFDVQLVPEVERCGGTVEAGPEVGGRGGRADDHRCTSARIASAVGSTSVAPAVRTSTAAVSLRPWPVSTQTTVEPGSTSILSSAASPAADDGSQKIPSRLAISSQASVFSSSRTETSSARPPATSASTSCACAGSAIRIAEAIVCARSLACPPTSRSVAPSSANPFA